MKFRSKYSNINMILIINRFILKFNDNADELKGQIVAKNEAKLEQIKKFMTELDQRIAENEDETKTNISEFQKRMKHTFRKFENTDYEGESELVDLRDNTDNLESELINIEMQFIEMEDVYLQFKTLSKCVFRMPLKTSVTNWTITSRI